MKRKLILMGGKTHVISLPAQFVKKYNLKKGKELEVNIDQNQIIISTDNEMKKDKELILKSNDNLPIKLKKAYQLGYDQIYIKNIYNLKKLENIINSLPGMEIIDYESNLCKLKQITEMNFKEFNNILRRVLLLMQSYNQSKSQNKKEAIERLINFCKRCINKKGFGSYHKSLSMYSFLCEIERLDYNAKQLQKFYEATLKPENVEKLITEGTCLYEQALA